MRFPGTLHLPDDHGSGTAVIIEVSDGVLSVHTESEQWGSWPLDEIEADRNAGNSFSLVLGGEALEFIANDRLRFAYEGLEYINEQQALLSRKFRGAAKRRSAHRQSAAINIDQSTPVEATPTETATPATQQPISPHAETQAKPSAASSANPDLSVIDMDDAPKAEVEAVFAEPAPTPAATLPPPEEPARTPILPEDPDAAMPPAARRAQPEESLANSPQPAEPVAPNAPSTPPVAEEALSGHAVRSDIPTTQGAREEAAAEADSLTVDLGEVEAEPEKTTPKKATRRFRKRKTEHVHTYRTAAAGGGMVRRVCDECHHVSIGGG